MFNHLKSEIYLNSICKFSSYFTENKVHVRYEVSAV
jgi:hypothetical protein